MQYQYGKVVLGVNNQRSGMDGRGATYMTSMRTFEALACGKPFLAAHSDAYEALGLVNGEHMVWVDKPGQAMAWAKHELHRTDDLTNWAKQGRAYVLANHTYGHRMRAIMEAIQ